MQHLDEGLIHAWLDGALPPNEAAAAEAHAQSCEECARAVAEARGLIAASSRILVALDDVPAVQHTAGTLSLPAARARRRAWWRRAGIGYAAAATALLAVGTTLVWSRLSPDAALSPRAAAVVDEAAAPQPAATELLKDSASDVKGAAAVPPAAKNAARETVADSRNVVPRIATQRAAAKEGEQAKKTEPKEELAIDRVVPLPGAMPRPAAPPVRQPDDRKALSGVATNAPKLSQTAQVLGRVLDAATGAPVVGAIVSIDTTRIAARTDSAGEFQLHAVPLGNQRVTVRALGFQLAQHTVAVAPSDSVQLAFTLQKSAVALEQVVATGAAVSARQEAQGVRRDAVERPQAVSGQEAARENAARLQVATVAGCYTLRAAERDKARDQDRPFLAAQPMRIQLEGESLKASRMNELVANRARTLSGTVRAESWRMVSDSLEITLADGDRRHALRFARSDARWISETAILEPCSVR